MPDVRGQIVALAREGTAHVPTMTYAEIRPMPSIGNPIGDWNWTGDCSSWVTQCFKWAGAPDPNGCDYDGTGNTQTLAAKGRPLGVGQVMPGDVVVFAVDQPLANQHTALIVAVDPTQGPVMSSMGKPGDPSIVAVSADGRTPSYFRFSTNAPTPSPEPGTPASLVWQGYRPAGDPPVLNYKKITAEQVPWLFYWRRILNAARVFPQQPPEKGKQYGWLTWDRTTRWKGSKGLAHDGIVGPNAWAKAGVR